MKKSLTIFTPTYNRAYTLPKLYGSLCRQTCKDFFWLVVDDGSTDDTGKVISSWKEEGKVNIIHIRQENSGKMSAHNTGVKNCNTELFFCVDSDDFLVDNAVEIILQDWIKSQKDERICGIVAYKAIGHEAAYKIPARFPITGTSTLGNLYRNGFKGDTSLIFKTDVLRKYPFPVIPGEKFITEAYVYNQIDMNYELQLLDECLTKCEYMPDGYTNNNLLLHLKNPMGWCLYYLQKAEYESNNRRKYNLSQAYSYYLMYKDMNYATEDYTLKSLNLSFSLKGLLLYFRRKIKYRKEMEQL